MLGLRVLADTMESSPSLPVCGEYTGLCFWWMGLFKVTVKRSPTKFATEWNPMKSTPILSSDILNLLLIFLHIFLFACHISFPLLWSTAHFSLGWKPICKPLQVTVRLWDPFQVELNYKLVLSGGYIGCRNCSFFLLLGKEAPAHCESSLWGICYGYALWPLYTHIM